MKLYYAPGACSLSPHIVAREAGLAPHAGTIERYRLQEWLGFLNSEIHKTWGALFDSRADRAPVIERLKQRLSFLEGELKGRPTLLPSGFSVADAYLFTLLNWAGFTGVDLAPYPALMRYVERIGARPKVREALGAEGLLQEKAA